MSTLTTTNLRLHCERRVAQWAAPEQLTTLDLSHAALIQRITAIVARNVQSGRAQRVLATTAPEQIERYIDRVIATFIVEHDRLDRLAAGEADAWTRLFQQLAQRAQWLLNRITTSPATAPEAIEFAQAACEAIFRSTFPYDVSFDAWATLVLKNIIWQRYQRSRDLLDRNSQVESLEGAPTAEPGTEFSLHELLADPSADVFDQPEVREWLLSALDQLSSVTQERVLIELYFNERSIPEVAQRLGRSVQAVYNLKHRALLELKSILMRESFDAGTTLEQVNPPQEPYHGDR